MCVRVQAQNIFFSFTFSVAALRTQIANQLQIATQAGELGKAASLRRLSNKFREAEEKANEQLVIWYFIFVSLHFFGSIFFTVSSLKSLAELIISIPFPPPPFTQVQNLEETNHVLPVNFEKDKLPRLADEDFTILREFPTDTRDLITRAFDFGDNIDDLRPAFEAYTQGRIPGIDKQQNSK